MIYKAYNVNNYYISYIIEVDETNNHDITIQMYSNQMNTITQTLTEADIEIKKKTEQEELYLRKDEFGELSKRMQEKAMIILKTINIKWLTHTHGLKERKKNALNDAIIQYGSNILRNIETPIILISCTSPQTK